MEEGEPLWRQATSAQWRAMSDRGGGSGHGRAQVCWVHEGASENAADCYGSSSNSESARTRLPFRKTRRRGTPTTTMDASFTPHNPTVSGFDMVVLAQADVFQNAWHLSK